ncbi:MAG: preprotein translocase subunit YajC [Jatrophihabitans sp.]
MNYVPLVLLVLVIVALVALAGRARRKQQAVHAEMAARIEVGTDVMTTSGLYGTVVVVNADDTVQLSIAAGVEVRWEIAALRDVASLPVQFRARTTAVTPDSELADRVDLGKDDPGRGAEPV